MDEKSTKDLLKEQFDTLPTSVQKAITSIDLSAILQQIVKDNKLMIDQAGGLDTETVLVLFGLEPGENFTNNLMKNLGLSSIQASVVTHDVNELIFKKVRENLKQINNDKLLQQKKEEEAEVAVAGNPSKETVLAGIEQPENIKSNEQSISMSSLRSSIPTPQEVHSEMANEGIEIRPAEQPFGQVKINNLPEIAPEAILPMVSSTTTTLKPSEPFHVNISPVSNIVEAKLTSTVAVPNENIVIQEKTKIPSKPAVDPYRESII